MYQELEKYRNPSLVEGVGVLPDGQQVKIREIEYNAPLGDLISDFIDHKNKPWWRRKHSHDHLTELYLKLLNKQTMTMRM